MLFALGFIAMFTIGGLSGVTHSIVPADTQQTDTYYVVAHFHYVLFGGLIFAIFGGFYYWWPKIFGKMLNEKLGKLNFWTMLIGFNLTFFPMHVLGLEGQPRRTYTYASGHGLGQPELLGHHRLVRDRARRGDVHRQHHLLHASGREGAVPTRGTHAPWSGRSPRRCPSTTSLEIPTVEARDDFWHRKYTEDAEGRLVRLPSGGSDSGTTGAVATLEADSGAGAGHGDEDGGGDSGDGHDSAAATGSTCRRRRTTRSS